MTETVMQKKIINLECKIKELETLSEKVTLTNDIKISLSKYIETNEKLLMELPVEKNIDKMKYENIIIEYKWIILVVIVSVVSFVHRLI